MGSSRGKTNNQREDNAYNQSQQAYKDWQPSELQKQSEARTLKFQKQWDAGTDVKDIDALNPYYDIFEGSKRGQENSRVGTGVLALGGQDNQSGQANELQQMLQSEKEQNASGMLYNAANQTQADMTNQGNYLIEVDQQMKSGRAGLAQQGYSTMLNRPKSIPWWQTALGVAGQAGMVYATGGMSGPGGLFNRGASGGGGV